jgi:hypothetical protein
LKDEERASSGSKKEPAAKKADVLRKPLLDGVESDLPGKIVDFFIRNSF